MSKSLSRRRFVKSTSLITAGACLLAGPLWASAPPRKWTVGEIMDLFISKVNGAPFAQTVDTLKSGTRETEVTGIITTMFATIPVIRQAISSGANFIIAHEPTFYGHLDNTEWLMDNPVYQFKARLLKEHNIAVWRNHDYIHSHRPDGVYSGVLDQLGWKKYSTEAEPWKVTLAPTRLDQLIGHLKEQLKIDTVRFIGDEDQICRKVLLMPGAAGGQRHIKAIVDHQPDVALVGELQEWETAEFVRDARATGQKLSLVVMGHTDSEDGGSIFMRDWLKQHVPDVKSTHIHSGNPFSFK